jgi:hypothetical protein
VDKTHIPALPPVTRKTFPVKSGTGRGKGLDIPVIVKVNVEFGKEGGIGRIMTTQQLQGKAFDLMYRDTILVRTNF